MVEIGDAALQTGVQYSVWYALVFTFAIVAQTYRKFQQKFQFKKEGKRFVRWDVTNKDMLAADRAVGNFMEWGPIFLLLFWCNIILGLTERAEWAAIIWLLARCLYVLLTVFLGGYGVGGPRVTIFLSTIPGYVALIMLFLPLLPYLFP